MVVFTGKTIEEAIQKGLTTLALNRSEASIRVLVKETKGFLGLFGKKPAQVDVVPLYDEVEEVFETLPTSQPVLEPEAVSEPANEVVVETAERDDFDAFVAKEFGEEATSDESAIDLEDVRQDVLAYVEKIIYEMDLEASITVRGNRRQMILQIDTPEPGRIIGYHGKVLKSLQLLAQNYLHDRYSRHFNVLLNVHDYLENRLETLTDMAHKAARRVLDSGRPYRLNPMTNNERKIIHKTISSLSGVESYSEGDDPDRYVVVVPRD